MQTSGTAESGGGQEVSAQDSSDTRNSQRSPLEQWRTLSKRTFATVAAFSVFVNLLMLTVPIYLFQLSDRVLTSRSTDTLLMLSVLAVTFLGVLALLDICRRQVLSGLSNRLETILGGHV
ncbi:MAG TPA: type I secretion system permease/ATPase, partial [Hyphomicrobium sp.]|nr:type I secretion system permease/ATPase [Hyphomicrobium sp.]